MSAPVKHVASLPVPTSDESAGVSTPKAKGSANYKGFVAGVFSGIAKLSVGHPFDTIKVRLQTAPKSQFAGPWDCVVQTIRNEGFNGIYKGATPPLIGWMFMDSLMLGSLTFYRKLLNENVFQPLRARPTSPHIWTSDAERKRLPAVGHGMAGILAGWTVSFIAAPIEHVKARLQIQYASNKASRLYSGPIDCTRKILAQHGARGLWHGLTATLLFRTQFFFWWGSYDVFTRALQKQEYIPLSTPAVNFWAGGLSAQVFWLTTYPTDVIKQRIMTDSLDPVERRYPRWRDAAKAVYREAGWKGYWRGFVPCFLRAFPANAAALVAFEGVMRRLE
ncbi:hypothetical protein LTR91_002729 [Friedmanniomyces endolithicus]|uniref:Mitochondrial substrate carrier family protein L n=1 Tax=Friedmanniomyces endolithicus TaxID=329885 RepID=A0AAN6KZ98_9PEZI|nr:hypothetical protein LTR35_006437 [Friedmanniomyces endolithicus]KAK0298627.1 hypothetical protein LTS00_003009 [Friedmanniomyces endolithicus]KAK0328178.1 hypothetical protein LTR82_000106 [Friedmanniomyces endolithicus]KAK0916950.1 hypothetical protein LTR57_012672 [Friedmanniomyces endolithicus]KAK0988016.1 hypothetical protein LTS01_009345 [Friedmanniomyces endolithicus]